MWTYHWSKIPGSFGSWKTLAASGLWEVADTRSWGLAMFQHVGISVQTKAQKSLAIPGFIQVLENNSETFKTLTKANFPSSFFQISYAKKQKTKTQHTKKHNLFLCLTFVRTLKRNWTSTVKKKWLLQEQSSVHTIIIALWSEVGLEIARQRQHEQSNDFFYIYIFQSAACVSDTAGWEKGIHSYCQDILFFNTVLQPFEF